MISERKVTSRSRKLSRSTKPITSGARSRITWLKSSVPAASPATWAVTPAVELRVCGTTLERSAFIEATASALWPSPLIGTYSRATE